MSNLRSILDRLSPRSIGAMVLTGGSLLGAAALTGCVGQTTAAAPKPTPDIVQQLATHSGKASITRAGQAQGNRYIFTSELITFLSKSKAYSLFEDDARGGYQGPPPHIHVRQDEGFYILQGQVTFRAGPGLSQTIVAHPGDYVSVPKGTLHTWAVTGKSMARVLTFFTPPGDFESMIRFAGHPTTATQPPIPRPLDKATINKIGTAAQKYYIAFPKVAFPKK